MVIILHQKEKHDMIYLCMCLHILSRVYKYIHMPAAMIQSQDWKARPSALEVLEDDRRATGQKMRGTFPNINDLS